MTDTATAAPLADIIAARLTAALAPTHLEVRNDSHLHAGHMGDDGTGESHFTVVVESPAFVGASRVARQRGGRAPWASLMASLHCWKVSAPVPTSYME